MSEMKRNTLFITGTNTGVGKTVLTALLARFLREQGVNAAALKPVCSGRRDDARALHAAMNGALTLDEINPWHFRAPIAPLLAARRENQQVKLAQVLAHARAMRKRFDMVLVEGAGGLFSPLGEDFNSRDLIVGLRARPIVVCPNRLGAVNQALLTLHALPASSRAGTSIVLMSPPKPDPATADNARLLGQLAATERILTLPRLGRNFDAAKVPKNAAARRMLDALLSC
jgi:dethiobiotin synthetase